MPRGSLEDQVFQVSDPLSHKAVLPRAEEPSTAGTVLDGRYELLEQVGRGGMGLVFKARQLVVDRIVAVKILPSDAARDQVSLGRFLKEIRAIGALRSPYTVTLYDSGQLPDGRPYYTMEFLEGKTLGQELTDRGPLPVQRAARFVFQICDSLDEAHSKGILHRDIKPENLFISQTGGEHVKLLDFGIAKFLTESSGERLTRENMLCGTPEFAAPEMAVGSPATPSSDLYSLGIVLYEMLAGDVPFRDSTGLLVMMKHLNDRPRSLRSDWGRTDVSTALEAFIRRALEKDPSRRFSCVAEFRAAFGSAVGLSPEELGVASAGTVPCRNGPGVASESIRSVVGPEGCHNIAPGESPGAAIWPSLMPPTADPMGKVHTSLSPSGRTRTRLSLRRVGGALALALLLGSLAAWALGSDTKSSHPSPAMADQSHAGNSLPSPSSSSSPHGTSSPKEAPAMLPKETPSPGRSPGDPGLRPVANATERLPGLLHARPSALKPPRSRPPSLPHPQPLALAPPSVASPPQTSKPTPPSTAELSPKTLPDTQAEPAAHAAESSAAATATAASNRQPKGDGLRARAHTRKFARVDAGNNGSETAEGPASAARSPEKRRFAPLSGE